MNGSATPALSPLFPKSRYVLFGFLAVVGCAIDLVTKSWIFHRLGPPGFDQEPPIIVWPGVFSLTTSLNKGALFGFGQGFTPVFATLSIGAAFAILYWLFIVGAAVDRMLTIALGLLMAGIFGNLYDRLGLHRLQELTEQGQLRPVYAVRDWLHFEIEGVINWPVFNIADVCLVCGASLLMLHALLYSEAPRPASKAATA